MDDLTLRRPQDASRISLTEAWEVRYWTNRYGVTESKLREAVRAVGHSADAVKRYLGK